MTCPNCKEFVPENAKFCPHCGYALPEPVTREQRRESTTNNTGNVFLAYAKNNFLLLLILILIAVGLFFWKAVVGIIALILILMMYYLRATSTRGAKEGASKKLQEQFAQQPAAQPQMQQQQAGYQQQPQQPARRSFNSMGNVVILIVSAAVTLLADFAGTFIKLEAQAESTTFDASTPMSLYQALNLGGVAAKLTNALGLQIDIQGILIAVFYIIVAIPVLVIILTFAGGRFSRFVLSLIACSTYVGSIGYLFYETHQLQQMGITLGLTPGIMYYVAIISSFVMLVYSTRVKR